MLIGVQQLARDFAMHSFPDVPDLSGYPAGEIIRSIQAEVLLRIGVREREICVTGWCPLVVYDDTFRQQHSLAAIVEIVIPIESLEIDVSEVIIDECEIGQHRPHVPVQTSPADRWLSYRAVDGKRQERIILQAHTIGERSHKICSIRQAGC